MIDGTAILRDRWLTPTGPEDVRRFLGKPEHWKAGYSAYETAQSWFRAGDIPPAIRNLLLSDEAYSSAVLVKATFEKRTSIDELPRGPSQTDVLATLKIGSKTIVLGVEGKVNESFGRLVSEWNDYSPSKLRRLAGLVERLRLRSEIVGTLRYQLLHRSVAALIEANREGAMDAMMIVQSFSPDDVRTGFSDFQTFAAALGVPVAEPGVLSPSILLGEIRLRLGWTINAICTGSA